MYPEQVKKIKADEKTAKKGMLAFVKTKITQAKNITVNCLPSWKVKTVRIHMNKERDKFLDKACTVALPETAEKVKTPVIWPRGYSHFK